MHFTTFEAIFFKNDQEIERKIVTNLEEKKNCIKFNFLEYNTILDLEEKTFTRENDEFLFFLDIKNNSCKIYLKKEGMELPIEVDYCELNILNNKIIVEYMIETDDAKNKIIITKEGESNE